MPRNDQVIRQWHIWRVLATASAPLSLADIRALLPSRSTLRTLRRDIDALRAIPIPVRVRRDGRETRYAVFDDGPPLRLDPDSTLALLIARDALQLLRGTAPGDALDHLYRRLAADRRATGDLDALVRSVVVCDESAAAPARATLDAARDALTRSRQIILDYESLDGRRSTRTVHPHALLAGPRGLYLHGHDERARALRTFRLDRVHATRVTDRPARPPNVAPASHFAGSLGIYSPEHAPRTFLIRIHSATAARLLRENPWHHTQRLTREPGGTTWLLQLDLRSSRELLPRVLALGPDAEALSPPTFRRDLDRLARATLRRYERRHAEKRAGPRCPQSELRSLEDGLYERSQKESSRPAW